MEARGERAADGTAVWRGVLVTPAGQRLPFSTLAQLDRWLCELVGWQDPPEEGKAEPALTFRHAVIDFGRDWFERLEDYDSVVAQIRLKEITSQQVDTI